ncbi:MAG TPA: hypothetical protein DD417_20805 [Elusimicrobia bacterium]|nr:hypothetical protein [Elusimicrobiota bacterium]
MGAPGSRPPRIWYDCGRMAGNPSPRRILVVVLDNLGDAVMGSALLAPLRRLHPGAQLGLWVKEYARGVFDFEDPALRVHAADPFWDKAPGRPPGGLAAFRRALGEIREVGYDAALVLNADWKRALACLAAGIPERIGHCRRRSGLFLNRAFPLPAGPAHVVSEHADLLSRWEGRPVPADCLRPDIGLAPAQREAAARWRAGIGGAAATVVAVHAVTGDPEKNWPLERWREFMEALGRERPSCRFAALSAPREEPALRAAFGGLPPGLATIVPGSVSEMKPFLAAADLFVGGDSGPGHMAAALGAPVLSLFGPTDPGRYRPFGAAAATLRREPLRELPVPEVLARARELLATSAGKGSSRGRCTS